VWQTNAHVGTIQKYPILKTRLITNVWPANTTMSEIIKQMINSESPCPIKPEFCFKLTLEAAEKKNLILMNHNLDLNASIKAPSKSTVGYGLEFTKPSILLPLLRYHPLWPKMKLILEKGSQWPKEPITEEE
jgi:hypothetical protein